MICPYVYVLRLLETNGDLVAGWPMLCAPSLTRKPLAKTNPSSRARQVDRRLFESLEHSERSKKLCITIFMNRDAPSTCQLVIIFSKHVHIYTDED